MRTSSAAFCTDSFTEAAAKLPDELLAHQLNLLCTLSLDSFGIETRLLLQLRGDSL